MRGLIKSFRGRLFLIFIAAAMAIITLTTIIECLQMGSAVKLSVQRDLQHIAARTAGEVEQYFTGKVETLMATREMLSNPHSRFEAELMLKRLTVQFLHFKELGLFDASTKELIASSSFKGNISLSDEAMKAVQKGSIYKSPVLFTESNLPYIRLALPLFWQGEVTKVLMADLDILAIWNKIDSIRIGDTGRTSLLSHEGVFFADKDKERVLKGKRWQDFEKAPLSGDRGATGAKDIEGMYVYAAHEVVPSMGWRVVITQERKEALSFLRIIIYQAVIAVVLSAIACYFIADWLSRHLSMPVEELFKGVQQIANGNFEYKVPQLFGTELSALAEGLNSMAKSIAEKERVEKEFAKSERLAAVGRLAADVAHEINNPLAIMKNYIYIIGKKKMKEDDPNQQYLRIIDGEIDRVAKIIRSFNEFYKGTQIVSMEEIDLMAPLEEVLAFCREDLEGKGIAVEERIAESAKVMADKDKLKQVFLNLIKNAAEAMPDGGRLTVETKKGDGKISISVTDTGMGISKEGLEKLFTPFFSTKGVKGTGLGLSVSYGIIKNFNGDIKVESEEGKETTFRVVLPVA